VNRERIKLQKMREEDYENLEREISYLSTKKVFVLIQYVNKRMNMTFKLIIMKVIERENNNS